MAGYPVIDPAGVDIYDEEGNLTHYDLGDTVPLSKLISRRYSWLVNRGYLSEVETDDWGSTVWGEISGTLSSQTDLQNALDAKLNLTGGTLTGTLNLKNVPIKTQNSAGSYRWQIDGSGNFYLSTLADGGGGVADALTINRTTLAATLTGDLTIGKSDARLTVDSTANDGYANIQALANKYAGVIVRTGSSPRWGIVKSNYGEPGSNVGSDLLITGYSDAGSSLGNWLTIERANGKVTLNGALALSGSQHTIKNGVPATLNFAKGSQWGYSSGYRAIVLGDTAGSPNNVTVSIGYDPVGNANGSFTGDGREVLFRNAVEFTTPNAANNAWLKPLKFSSTGNTTLLGLTAGATTLTGDLTISKANALVYANSSSGLARFAASSIAGQYADLQLYTGGSSRWSIRKNITAESGSNAGSDLEIAAFTDGGGALLTPLTITRSTGDIVLASTTDSSSSTTGAIKTAGGMGIAKKLYVGSDLSVAGQQLLLTHGNPYVSMHSTHTAPGNRYFTGLYNNASGGELRLHADGGAMALYVSNSASYPFRIYSSSWNGTSYDITERFKVDGSNGTATISGNLTVTGTTDSSSSITGAVTTAGGMGIAKKLYVGTDLNVAGTTITAGVKKTLSTKTGAYTLTATDHIIVATSGTWNATLPTAASVAGTEYIIKNSGTGTITVDTTSSQTIDGSLTFGLSQYESITVVSDGTNWVIIQ